MPPAIKLNDVKLFRDLSKHEFRLIKSCLREKSYGRSEILFLEGRQCDRIFIVRSGRVKIFRMAASGREQILEVLEPGDTCACNPGAKNWRCSASAQALTNCQLWILSREQYIRLVHSDSELSRTLNRLFAERLCRFSSLIEKVSLDNPKRRLVKFILDMLDSQDEACQDKYCLCAPFTHEEIAQRLGLVRETVTRHLQQLKRLKLIDIKPNQIIIRNNKALQEILKE